MNEMNLIYRIYELISDQICQVEGLYIMCLFREWDCLGLKICANEARLEGNDEIKVMNESLHLIIEAY